MKLRAKEQFNARVRPEVREIAEKLCMELNFTNEEMMEVALAALIGTKDNVIDAKRIMAQMKAKELKLTFNSADRQSGQLELIAA